jgi:hypothetical protein
LAEMAVANTAIGLGVEGDVYSFVDTFQGMSPATEADVDLHGVPTDVLLRKFPFRAKPRRK